VAIGHAGTGRAACMAPTSSPTLLVRLWSAGGRTSGRAGRNLPKHPPVITDLRRSRYITRCFWGSVRRCDL
jgi:hypothetical protein